MNHGSFAFRGEPGGHGHRPLRVNTIGTPAPNEAVVNTPSGPSRKNQILLLDPRDESKKGTVGLNGGKRRAFAYCASSQDLVGLGSGDDYSDPHRVHEIDLATGTVTPIIQDFPAGQHGTHSLSDGAHPDAQFFLDVHSKVSQPLLFDRLRVRSAFP